MLLTELIIAFLATWQIIEIIHHSYLLSGWRARVELIENWWWHGLLSCPFCMSPWVAWLVCALLLGVRYGLGLEIGWLILLPIYGLAVARLANLGNDVGHAWCRTPRENEKISKPLFDEGTHHDAAGYARGNASEARGNV